jgi:hypothetical protein
MSDLERLLTLSIAAVAARKALKEPRPRLRRLRARAALACLILHRYQDLKP